MPTGSSPEDPAEVEIDKVDATAPDVDPADPSPAEAAVEKGDKPAETDKGEKPDLLTAVKAALKPKEKAPASEQEPDSKSEKKPEADKGAEADESDDLTEEEISRLKPKTKKRIDDLLAERAERDGTITALKPKAEQFDKIVGFIADAGLVPAEVNRLFDIGKNLKSNPRAAYDQIKPIYETLQRMYGDVLPDDLRQRVEQGFISADDAKALAVSRTEAAVSADAAKRMQERDDERRAQERTQVQIDEVKAKVSEWETAKVKADPDWSLKQPQVMRAIKVALLERGTPPTAAEAVQIAEVALAEVDGEFKKLAPRKKAIAPVTDVGSSRSVAKPANILEAARAGLAKARGG